VRLGIGIALRTGPQCRTRLSGRSSPPREIGRHHIHTHADRITCPTMCAAGDRTVELKAGQSGTQRAEHNVGGGVQALGSSL